MSDAAYFSSFLAERLTAYLSFRRSLGYEFRGKACLLRQFDRVVAREMPTPGPVSREVVMAYLGSLAHLKSTTRRVRLSMVRQFLRFQQQSDPDTYIPERSIEPGRASPRCPYIFNDAEIRALVKAAHHYPARYRSRRWLLYPTLFGLLYASGMRISEALDLTLRDVDFRDAVVRIRKTKFHKARLIPLQASTCAALRRYLIARAERAHSAEGDASFFVKGDGQRLSYTTVRTAFHACARMAGIEDPGAAVKPRLHDLRHTAAVRRLHLWYREGKNVQALLPVLVTYLGHSSVSSTAIYLTTTGELLAEASARFEAAYPQDVVPSAPGDPR